MLYIVLCAGAEQSLCQSISSSHGIERSLASALALLDDFLILPDTYIRSLSAAGKSARSASHTAVRRQKYPRLRITLNV